MWPDCGTAADETMIVVNVQDDLGPEHNSGLWMLTARDEYSLRRFYGRGAKTSGVRQGY